MAVVTTLRELTKSVLAQTLDHAMVGHPTSRVIGDEIPYTQTMGEGERVVSFRI